MIPRIIHQTWKTQDIPERWKRLQQTWLDHHPTWEYRLWTDEEIRAFVEQQYGWFLTTFDAYPVSLSRAEVFRYFILYHHGGIYADLDLECLRPLDELLEGKKLVLGLEPDSHVDVPGIRERGLERIVCNAFMASVPLHPFWKHVWRYLSQFKDDPGVLDATGVFLMTRAYDSYPDKQEIDLLPSPLFYPLTKFEAGEPGEHHLAELASQAYTVHYWHGSWWREALFSSVRKRVLGAKSGA